MRSRLPIHTILFASLAASLFGCAAPRPTARDEQADRAAIDALHRRDEAAVLAANADSLIALWDEDIISMPAGGPIIRGKALNSQMLRNALAQQGEHRPLTYELRFEEVQLLGDRAFEWGMYRGSAVIGSDTLVGMGKVMRLLVRDSTGAWHVARTMFTADPVTAR
jgi:ketosteroid isomerase-like protein